MLKALITGVNGQDGSYLAEYLIKKGYYVIGTVRRSSTQKLDNISSILGNSNFNIIEADITDSGCINDIVNSYMPDEVYNLAAQSHVGTSFNQPSHTFDVNTKGVLNLLEAIRLFKPDAKFYQASTSEMFGKNYKQVGDIKYQDETTEFMPQSPYAISKLAAHQLVGLYRKIYNLHASCGILFNHESERRGENFVTRKITKWISSYIRFKNRASNPIEPVGVSFDNDNIYINNCKFPKLRLGNIDAHRDWGHAQDYVHAMWLMLQQHTPDDYVISTANTHSVKEFLELAFQEIGIIDYDYTNYIAIDQSLYRPAEVDYLLGDRRKAFLRLGWSPTIGFQELVKGMVWSDMNGS